MNIVPNPNAVGYKTGQLNNITVDEIVSVLGFSSNVNDDPTKVVNSWGATVDDVEIAIWDYKGSHQFGQFSTYGPHETFLSLFGSSYDRNG